MPLGPLPSPGPFGRIVDVRVFPHGFTTQQADANAGPAGSAIVRPNIEDAAWHAAGSQKWGGNIVWTGSTPRHTVAFNGVRAFVAGEALRTGAIPTENARHGWLSYNGVKYTTPGFCFGAALKIYDSLPTEQTYSGTGNGTLEMQTPSTGPGALTGDYTVRCIDNAPPARFLVTGPDGQPVGVADAGIFTAAPVLFDGVIRFELQHGLIGFQVGDQWTVTVEEAEQLIAITEGMTYAPTATVVRRRGVSDGASWRTLLTIATGEWETDEQFPTPHFWSINASATRAVTTRWIRGTADAGNNEITPVLVVHREIDLDDLTHSKAIETPARFGYSETITLTSSETDPETDECVGTGASKTITAARPGVLTTRIGQFFVDDVLAYIELESTHSVSSSSSSSPDSGSSWSSTESYLVDLVIQATGVRISLYDMSSSRSGVYNYPGGPYSLNASRNVMTRKILAITQDWRHIFMLAQSSGSSTSTAEEGAYQTDTNTSTTWLFDDEVIESSSGSSVDSGEIQNEGPGAPPCDTPVLSRTIDFSVLFSLSENASNNSYHVSEVAIRDENQSKLAVIQGNGSPIALDTSQPAGRKAVFQTVAQDARGNWLMLIGSNPETMHLRAGGPDSLTPSKVHTLTDHPGADLWNIGAF